MSWLAWLLLLTLIVPLCLRALMLIATIGRLDHWIQTTSWRSVEPTRERRSKSSMNPLTSIPPSTRIQGR